MFAYLAYRWLPIWHVNVYPSGYRMPVCAYLSCQCLPIWHIDVCLSGMSMFVYLAYQCLPIWLSYVNICLSGIIYIYYLNNIIYKYIIIYNIFIYNINNIVIYKWYLRQHSLILFSFGVWWGYRCLKRWARHTHQSLPGNPHTAAHDTTAAHILQQQRTSWTHVNAHVNHAHCFWFALRTASGLHYVLLLVCTTYCF